MRLFIAITLSKEMKNALITYMHQLKKQGVEGRYVPAQNLHMTLAFIGEYGDPDKVETSDRAGSDATFSPDAFRAGVFWQFALGPA